MIPYGKCHSKAVSWNTSINGYKAPLPLFSGICLCKFILISSWLHNDLQVAVIGPKLDLTYDYEASVFRVFD